MKAANPLFLSLLFNFLPHISFCSVLYATVACVCYAALPTVFYVFIYYSSIKKCLNLSFSPSYYHKQALIVFYTYANVFVLQHLNISILLFFIFPFFLPCPFYIIIFSRASFYSVIYAFEACVYCTGPFSFSLPRYPLQFVLLYFCTLKLLHFPSHILSLCSVSYEAVPSVRCVTPPSVSLLCCLPYYFYFNSYFYLFTHTHNFQ